MPNIECLTMGSQTLKILTGELKARLPEEEIPHVVITHVPRDQQIGFQVYIRTSDECSQQTRDAVSAACNAVGLQGGFYHPIRSLDRTSIIGWGIPDFLQAVTTMLFPLERGLVNVAQLPNTRVHTLDGMSQPFVEVVAGQCPVADITETDAKAEFIALILQRKWDIELYRAQLSPKGQMAYLPALSSTENAPQ